MHHNMTVPETRVWNTTPDMDATRRDPETKTNVEKDVLNEFLGIT